MIFDDINIKSFRKSSNFKLLGKPTSLSFIETGELLLSTFPSNIQVYNALNPELITKVDIQNEKAEFFSNNTILLSNNRTVTYLSTHDTVILRRFVHEKEVKDFSCGTGDTFMVNSDCVYIYDIRSTTPSLKLNINSVSGKFIDENTFCVANSSLIRLYDIRNTKGPYKIKTYPNIKKIEYIRSADKFVISNTKNYIHSITDNEFKLNINIDILQDRNTAMTPDGKYYVVSHNGFLKFYNLNTKKSYHDYMDNELCDAVIAFNPMYAEMVTGNSTLRFWIPEDDDL